MRRLHKLAVAAASAGVLLASMPNDKNLAAWVEKRVRDLQPSRDERRLDEIGWAHGILEAEKVARQNRRPVFLFTYDGNIETGRC